MKIEAGHFYKHPQIEMPYIAISRGVVQGIECWILVSMVAFTRFALDHKPIPFTERWGVRDEYAERSGMKEIDPKDYVVNEDGETVSFIGKNGGAK